MAATTLKIFTPRTPPASTALKTPSKKRGRAAAATSQEKRRTNYTEKFNIRKKVRRWQQSWVVWFRNFEMGQRAKFYSKQNWWARAQLKTSWWKCLRKLRKKKFSTRHFFMWRYAKNLHRTKSRSLGNFYFHKLWLQSHGNSLKLKYLRSLLQQTKNKSRKTKDSGLFLPLYTVGSFMSAAFFLSSRSMKYRLAKRSIYVNGFVVKTLTKVLLPGDVVYLNPLNFLDAYRRRRDLSNKHKVRATPRWKLNHFWYFKKLSRFVTRRNRVLTLCKKLDLFTSAPSIRGARLRRKNVCLGVLKANLKPLNSSLVVLRRGLLASFYKPFSRQELMRFSSRPTRIPRKDWWQVKTPFVYRSSTYWHKRLLERVISY